MSENHIDYFEQALALFDVCSHKATLFSHELNAKVRECRSEGLGCGMMLGGALFLIGLLIMFGGGV